MRSFIIILFIMLFIDVIEVNIFLFRIWILLSLRQMLLLFLLLSMTKFTVCCALGCCWWWWRWFCSWLCSRQCCCRCCSCATGLVPWISLLLFVFFLLFFFWYRNWVQRGEKQPKEIETLEFLHYVSHLMSRYTPSVGISRPIDLRFYVDTTKLDEIQTLVHFRFISFPLGDESIYHLLR